MRVNTAWGLISYDHNSIDKTLLKIASKFKIIQLYMSFMNY